MVRKGACVLSDGFQDEEELKKLVHIQIQGKGQNVDALFDTNSHANLMSQKLFFEYGLKTKSSQSSHYLWC